MADKAEKTDDHAKAVVEEMQRQFDKLLQQVGNQVSVPQSVEQLLQNIVTFLNNIPASSDAVTQGNLNAIKELLTKGTKALVVAVIQNTVASPTPGQKWDLTEDKEALAKAAADKEAAEKADKPAARAKPAQEESRHAQR